jgi:hypothetical protein
LFRVFFVAGKVHNPYHNQQQVESNCNPELVAYNLIAEFLFDLFYCYYSFFLFQLKKNAVAANIARKVKLTHERFNRLGALNPFQ